MSGRRDKGRAVANFLRTRTGIPEVTWLPDQSRIYAPHPYMFDVYTLGSLSKHAEAVAALPTVGMPAVVRYDRHLESLDDAWITFRLATGAKLLEAHYNSPEMAERIRSNDA
jgi:hypothetical protein